MAVIQPTFCGASLEALGAPTRDERPGQRALEERSCGTDARGQRDRQRQRGLREAGAWGASEKRTFSKLQLTGLWLAIGK